MIGQFLRLETPKPADWGYKVSVCIALSCARRNKLIYVTDNRASFGDFSGEYLTVKSDHIGPNWSVLFAGNDVEHADPIIKAARRDFDAATKNLPRLELPSHQVVDIVDNAYAEHLQAQIENKILRKHHFDSESFQKTGKIKCTPEVCVFLGRRSEFLRESDQGSSEVDQGSERSDAGEKIVEESDRNGQEESAGMECRGRGGVEPLPLQSPLLQPEVYW